MEFIDIVVSLMLFVFGLSLLIAVTFKGIIPKQEDKSKFKRVIICNTIGILLCTAYFLYTKFNTVELKFVEAIKESASDSEKLTTAIILGMLTFIISWFFIRRNKKENI